MHFFGRSFKVKVNCTCDAREARAREIQSDSIYWRLIQVILAAGFVLSWGRELYSDHIPSICRLYAIPLLVFKPFLNLFSLILKRNKSIFRLNKVY